jgi:hypothetical protein
MGSISVKNVEGVTIVLLVVGYLLWFVVRRLQRSREDFRIGVPLAIGFLIRLAAIIGISASGLEATLRGGDETTFIERARYLATQPLGHGNLPHGPYQLHTDIFALQFKLGLPIGALRITQVGLATLGMVLILASVYDLAGGGRAARLAAWLLAFEPASIFFNSALHKEPLMELASGLIVYGGTRVWQRLDVRGILLCALGGLIAVETRSYAGWFLVSAAVLVLLHASLRSLHRPLRAMTLVYAVVIAAFLVTPVLLQASSKKNLQQLQLSQNANSSALGLTVVGTGPNSDNLALEQVNFSTRGQIIKNLPKRIRDLVLKPYPWQLGNTSQRIGAVGTLIAYALLLLLVWYGWQSRGSILARTAPLMYPLLLLLMAYSLSAGNAGTGFRYRSHLVVLAIGAMAILRERVLQARAARTAPPLTEPEARKTSVRAPVTSPV